jgi:Pup amidohydrolase
VAIPKVCGIETEYGIMLRGAGESNPIAASSALINAYVNEVQRKVGWDFEDEAPGNDARGFAREGSAPPEVETNLVNTVLTNGARYYVDHAHPEYSTPECASPRQVVLYDKAGELILGRSMQAAARTLPASRASSSTRTTPTARGTRTGPTRTTSWTAACRSPALCST